jgi:uncharacterized glyoxalase superfamily protein PhnB
MSIMPGKYMREGFHAVTPYLMVNGVAALLEFLARAFEAKECSRMARGDGSVAHAEVRIGDSMVMLGEPPPEKFSAMPAQLYLYVPDCDAVYRRAVDAGGESVMPPTTFNFSGQRYGAVKDPSGNLWWIATHLEDLTLEESARRFAEWQREREQIVS